MPLVKPSSIANENRLSSSNISDITNISDVSDNEGGVCENYLSDGSHEK